MCGRFVALTALYLAITMVIVPNRSLGNPKKVHIFFFPNFQHNCIQRLTVWWTRKSLHMVKFCHFILYTVYIVLKNQTFLN